MSVKNLSLATRAAEFKSIIENSVCTDANNRVNHLDASIDNLANQLKVNRDHGNAVYLIGNGGSAGIASHAITDFTNVCCLRAFTLHDPSLITCMANDYGYENAYARIIRTIMHPGDILIAISSSGKSANICNAANMATEMGGIVITLSGFNHDNPLRKLGDVNFWLNSDDYGFVELGHAFILHNISDRIGMEMTQVKTTVIAEPA